MRKTLEELLRQQLSIWVNYFYKIFSKFSANSVRKIEIKNVFKKIFRPRPRKTLRYAATVIEENLKKIFTNFGWILKNFYGGHTEILRKFLPSSQVTFLSPTFKQQVLKYLKCCNFRFCCNTLRSRTVAKFDLNLL